MKKTVKMGMASAHLVVVLVEVTDIGVGVELATDCREIGVGVVELGIGTVADFHLGRPLACGVGKGSLFDVVAGLGETLYGILEVVFGVVVGVPEPCLADGPPGGERGYLVGEGGEICGYIVDIKNQEFPDFAVELSYDYVNNLIGKNIGKDTIKSILSSLEMQIVEETDEKLNILVPTYRVDVQRPCDVVEDILRVYGYNNVEFTSAVRSNLSSKSATDFKNDMQELISQQLTAIGFNEILNNSLTALSYYADCETYPEASAVKLMNPLSNDLMLMRQTLLFGGLESIAHNVNRRSSNLKMYEFGNIYQYDANADNSERVLARYSENTELGMWITGKTHDGNWAEAPRETSVFDLKKMVEDIFARLGVSEKELVTKQIKNDVLSPCLVYENRGGKVIAELGVVASKQLKKFDISQAVYFAHINWDALMKMCAKKKVTFADLPKTQPVKRDLALLIDKEVTFADIKRVVTQTEKRLLRDVTLFDVYEGKNLEAGKKSYAISITLQDDQNTLQDKQIDATMNKIIANLEKQVGAKLR